MEKPDLSRWRERAITIALGLGLVGFGLGVWHVIDDHTRLHGMWDFLLQQKQRGAFDTVPPAPPPPPPAAATPEPKP